MELLIPDHQIEFTLETDASDIGLGGVLRQGGKPVCYLSRTISKTEKAYNITENEVLAAIWCMEKCKYILQGRRFTLITDHKAIETIKIKIVLVLHE